jgi:Zn-dependent protease/CBS domain-containing protein
LLFVSVLLHELAHSLVARSRGMPVSSITLFLFGGVSNLGEEPKKPSIEFFMSIVGPGTSLVLAVIFFGLFSLMGNDQSPLAAILGYLALINVLLAAFNLLPGFPLDGGRVLRSIIWGSTGDLVKSTNIAATVGRFLGWGMIAFGALQLLFGGIIGGLWIMFIGWFLSSAADASRREVALRQILAGVHVKDVVRLESPSVSPDTSLDVLVRDVLSRQRFRAVPVCDKGKSVGIVSITDVGSIPQEEWTKTRVKEVMTEKPLFSVTMDDEITTALEIIGKNRVNQLLIEKEGQCSGLISLKDIQDYLRLKQELRV